MSLFECSFFLSLFLFGCMIVFEWGNIRCLSWLGQIHQDPNTQKIKKNAECAFSGQSLFFPTTNWQANDDTWGFFNSSRHASTNNQNRINRQFFNFFIDHQTSETRTTASDLKQDPHTWKLSKERYLLEQKHNLQMYLIFHRLTVV